MVWLKTYIKAWHPAVHLMMLGTILISLTSSMSIVFLPIFLITTGDLDPVSVGIITGSGALTAAFGGFIGGTLSDMMGRTRLLLISLLLLGCIFPGFLYLKSFALLLLLNILRGLFSSFFLTISKTLLADLTPKEKRFRVFSNRYLAGNIGYSIGPVVGTLFGMAGNTSAFLFTAAIYIGYGLTLAVFITHYKIGELAGTEVKGLALAMPGEFSETIRHCFCS